MHQKKEGDQDRYPSGPFQEELRGTHVNVNKAEVVKAIDSLSVGRALRADAIPAIIFREAPALLR